MCRLDQYEPLYLAFKARERVAMRGGGGRRLGLLGESEASLAPAEFADT